MLVLLLACDLEAPADPSSTASQVFEVPKGATAKSLGPALADADLISETWRWELYLQTSGDGTCLKAGKHSLSPAMPASELMRALCGAPLADDEPFTLIEGWRIQEIDAALVAKGWAEPGAFTAAVTQNLTRYVTAYPLPTDSLEGYLYPDTYKVEPARLKAPGGVEDFVQRLLTTFGERWGDAAAKAPPRALHDLVIMASMIEREEPTPENRPVVAGILWKRLDANWNLGVDATSRYTLPQWNDRVAFLKKLRDPTDPYNTRLRPGLPKGPIGSPGIDALNAAVNPVTTEWWYYLHDGKTFRGGRNEAEHEANRRKYNVY